MPSNLWTGDFLAHDDNFGSDLNIPRKHIDADNVCGVFVVKDSSNHLRALTAQAATLLLLPEYVGQESCDNIWIHELAREVPRSPHEDNFPRVVFRTVALEGRKYLEYVKAAVDGKGNRASQSELEWLSKRQIPKLLVVVEVSLPQLFPANMKKVASFVFDASKDCGFDERMAILNNFLFAHLPGAFYGRTGVKGLKFEFERQESGLVDHVELISSVFRS